MKDWISVSRSNPCEICEKSDNCTRSVDGNYCYCGREPNGSIRQNAGGQFLHILRDRRDPLHSQRQNPKQTAVASATREATKNWDAVALGAYNHPNAAQKRLELGAQLGVDIVSLERLGVGWVGQSRSSFWSFPERSATGQIIGINRRFKNGKKRSIGKRGLTFDPQGWSHSDVDMEHIYLVEGGSDTATLLTLGLSVVGRPSNSGGVDLLVSMLKPLPKDRLIVVVGECDRKSHESLSPSQLARHKSGCSGCAVCWPGWFGATRTAEQLAVQLNRRVAWTFPPDAAKDAREWLNSFGAKTSK